MGLRIRTNVASAISQRNFGSATKRLVKSTRNLASGTRINSAGDDAAGFAISENMRAKVRSFNKTQNNAVDAISLVQVGEGGLEETGNMLVRLRELAIQSSTDTLGMSERAALDKEYVSLKHEIDRIAKVVEFNGVRLIMGKDALMDAPGNEFNASSSSFPTEIQVGVDYFDEADAIDRDDQVNIIQIDTSNLVAGTHGKGSLNLGEGQSGTRITTKQAAQQTLAKVDSALTKISSYRAYLGSIQNRLTSALNNMTVARERSAESRSRISDTEYASETANYTQLKMLQQASTSVMTNANAQPEIALSLLG